MKQEARRFPLAASSGRAWGLFLLLAGVGLGVDLVSKSLAFAHVADAPVALVREQVLSNPGGVLPMHDPVVVIPRVLNFTLVLNHGAVFGIGAGARWFFMAFTVVAITAGLWIFGWRTRARDRLAHVSLALILAGAIGNFYDRAIYGAVRDFLHAFPGVPLPFGWRWHGGSAELFPWVFNVADMMLLAGIGLMMLRISRRPEGEVRGERVEEAGSR